MPVGDCHELRLLKMMKRAGTAELAAVKEVGMQSLRFLIAVILTPAAAPIGWWGGA